jgi:hypothetical protein
MGAGISTTSHCDPKYTQDVVPNADSVSPSSVNPNASKSSEPRDPFGDMPIQSRPETVEKKLHRKVSVLYNKFIHLMYIFIDLSVSFSV